MALEKSCIKMALEKFIEESALWDDNNSYEGESLRSYAEKVLMLPEGKISEVIWEDNCNAGDLYDIYIDSQCYISRFKNKIKGNEGLLLKFLDCYVDVLRAHIEKDDAKCRFGDVCSELEKLSEN